jgi:hypothetical protein
MKSSPSAIFTESAEHFRLVRMAACRTSTNYRWETVMEGSVVFNGVFELQDGVSEAEFLSKLKAFYEHFIEMGFASGYRILRRETLEGFGSTLFRRLHTVARLSIRTWKANTQPTRT